MIDSTKFKKIYEKIQFKENHNLIIGKIAQLSGVDANTVQEISSKLGFTDLTHVTPEQFEQICCAVKDSQKMVTPDTQKKVPIKDEENLNEPTNLNEADPQEDTNEKATTENEISLDLLYNIVYAYYLATKPNPDAKAVQFISALSNNNVMKSMAKKFSTITSRSAVAIKQDSSKPRPTALETIIKKMFAEIAKDQKESVATDKNP